jgi:hypothetical protein
MQKRIEKELEDSTRTSFDDFYTVPPRDLAYSPRKEPKATYMLSYGKPSSSKKPLNREPSFLFPGKNVTPREPQRSTHADLVKKDVMTYRYLRGAQEFGGSQTSTYNENA